MQKEAITYDHLHFQSHDQCKIHEVYTSRNNPTEGTSVKYSRHIGNILKVQKNATKHWDKHKQNEYKTEIKNKVLKL